MKSRTIRQKGVASQRGESFPRLDSGRPRSAESLIWELPGGKRLAEYALRVRLFTPSLLDAFDGYRDVGARKVNVEIGGQR